MERADGDGAWVLCASGYVDADDYWDGCGGRCAADLFRAGSCVWSGRSGSGDVGWNYDQRGGDGVCVSNGWTYVAVAADCSGAGARCGVGGWRGDGGVG